MTIELIELLKIGAPLLAIGGAWGGAKAALNGTKERVQKLEGRAETHETFLRTLAEQSTRTETKIDMLLQMEKKNG